MSELTIYTDGSCRMSLNKGGIGIVFVKNNKIITTFSKVFDNVTNNQMELMAIYCALQSITNPIESLTIISDSEYSIGVLTKSWNPKKNVEFINKIKSQLNKTQKLILTPIKFIHTRGHSGNEFNELADSLATSVYD